jgi:hypothetical protein
MSLSRLRYAINNFSSGTVCVVGGLLVTFSAIMADPPKSSPNSLLDNVRIIIPAILFASFLMWLKKKNSLNKFAFSLLAVSLPAYVMVMNWLAIFNLTNYRAHHKPFINFLALIYLAFFFSALIFGSKKKKNEYHP